MKIFVVVDMQSDWYPKQAFTLFRRYSNMAFVSNIKSADLIWIFSYYATLKSIISPLRFIYTLFNFAPKRRKSLKGIPMITTIHHLSESKENVWLHKIEILNAITDVYQTFSKNNVEFFGKYLTKPIIVLPYWVDTERFTPLGYEEKKNLRKQYGLPEDKTIIGSFQRDTERELVSPKLEKGPDIFCDIVEKLDRHRFFILLVGTRRDYVEKRLQDSSVHYKNLDKIPFEEMNRLYNVLDYYLVTSRCEGGPQAILEAMATKTKIFSTPVGVYDLLSPDVIFSTSREGVELLQRPYPNVLEKHYTRIQTLNCQRVVKQFENFFKNLVDNYPTLNLKINKKNYGIKIS